MLRGRFNEILEPAIKEYVDEVRCEISDSIMSFMFEKEGKAYFYNLQVTQIDEQLTDSDMYAENGLSDTGFPIWICMGGSKIPKEGCRRIQREGIGFRGREEQPPRECSFCGNTEFKKIEDLEEMREWVEHYQPRGENR